MRYVLWGTDPDKRERFITEAYHISLAALRVEIDMRKRGFYVFFHAKTNAFTILNKVAKLSALRRINEVKQEISNMKKKGNASTLSKLREDLSLQNQ